MGQVLHGRATTTETVRRAIQAGEASVRALAKRYGINPDTDGAKTQRSRFKSYPIGFFHLDIAEVRTEQGHLYLFVAIGRQ